MFRRILKKVSLMLSMCLLLTNLGTQVVQARENSYYVDPDTIVELVEKEGSSIDYLSEEKFTIVKNEKVGSYFTEKYNSRGEQIFIFNENGLYNEVRYGVNGEIYLNGEPITISDCDESGNLINTKPLRIGIDNDYELMAKRVKVLKNLPAGLTDKNLPELLGSQKKLLH